MKILVLGGSGFIGSWLIKRLKLNHNVISYDKVDPKFRYDDVLYVNGEITSPALLRFYMDGVDVVYHLASFPNTMKCAADPITAVDINCYGTAEVLTACRDMKVKRIILASTSLITSIYPHIYVTTKVFQEMLVRDFCYMYGLDYTILRYGICYGPNMTPGVVVHTFIEQALNGEAITVHGTGEQWRQYIYVEDLVDANVMVLSDKAINKTYNVVPNSITYINDIANCIARYIYGAKITYVPEREYDMDVSQLKGTKLKEDFGWEARTSLDTGIRKTIAWYMGKRRERK